MRDRQPEPDLCRECDRWETECVCDREAIDKTAEALAVAGEPEPNKDHPLDDPAERWKRPTVCDR